MPHSGDREKLEAGLQEAVFSVREPMRSAVLDGLRGGKRFRPMLCCAWYRATGGTGDGWVSPAIAVELIHRASLCHDDLPCMDDSATRNDRPSLHRMHCPATAVLAGDSMIAMAFRKLCAVPYVGEAGNVLAGTIASMAGGQVAELRQPDGASVIPSLGAWQRVVDGKTGSLLAASCRLGVLAASLGPRGSSKDLIDNAALFGTLLGRLYQLRDDLEDRDRLPAGALDLVEPAMMRLRGIAQATPLGKPLEGLLEELGSDRSFDRPRVHSATVD